MNKLIILAALCMSACGGGLTYQDRFDANKAKGMTFNEALVATDAECLNNPCNWQ